MNKLLLLSAAILAIGLGACTSSNRPAGSSDIAENPGTLLNPDAAKNKALGTPEFESIVHDFGKIKEGDIVKHSFTFKNTGKGPLSIAGVEAGCGCTDPAWTKTVIPPGGEGFVSAQFNSDGRSGANEKSVYVTFSSSTVDKITLKFKADVKAKPTQ